MSTRASIIVHNEPSFSTLRYMIHNYEALNGTTLVHHEKTYAEPDQHITMIVEGKAKDIHAIQLMATLLGQQDLKNENSILVAGNRIRVIRREYEPGKFTNDVLVNFTTHSPAVGDELLETIIGRVVLSFQKPKVIKPLGR